MEPTANAKGDFFNRPLRVVLNDLAAWSPSLGPNWSSGRLFIVISPFERYCATVLIG